VGSVYTTEIKVFAETLIWAEAVLKGVERPSGGKWKKGKSKKKGSEEGKATTSLDKKRARGERGTRGSGSKGDEESTIETRRSLSEGGKTAGRANENTGQYSF